MKGVKSPPGYTIIEVIIVLAISGLMFLVAANFINGKQERTSFVQGTNDLVSQMQNVLQDVTDGHYSDVPISCSQSGNGSSVDPTASGGSGQGTNSQCVFLGKLVHFYKSGTTYPEVYETISLAAARTTNPTPGEKGIPGVTTNTNIPQSLDVRNMHVFDAAGNDQGYYNIGFVQGLGTVADATNGVYQSGAQTIGLVYTSVLSSSVSVNNNENTINQVNLHAASSAAICLSDGTRYSVIFIGTPPGAASGSNNNNNNELSINAQQFATTYPGRTLC